MKIEELEFRQIENKIYPTKQLAYKFFVSDFDMVRHYYEIKPMTFGNILYAILRNYIRIWYWLFVRILWKIGFIDIPEYAAFSWKRYFRFSFWSPKKYA